MSSFQLSDAHVTAMLNGATTLYRTQFGGNGSFRWYFGDLNHQGELTPETADRVGTMLLAENDKSLRHEYGDDLPERSYRFVEDLRPVDPLKILKTAKCYEYQRCEHPGWESSEAAAFTRHLVNLAISGLPGYRDAPWGVTAMTDVLAHTGTDVCPRLSDGRPDATSLRYVRWTVARWIENLTVNERHYQKAASPHSADLVGTRSQLSMAREVEELLRHVTKL